MKSYSHLFSLFIILILFFNTSSMYAKDLRKEISLRGYWRFQVGDDKDYAKPNYNDANWETIKVPARWEDRGFPGYDGFAWYRTTFQLTDDLKEKQLVLDLGCIDDVDMVYINGRYLNGKGSFPPDLEKAWNVQRLYPLPHAFLHFNKDNVIAVRVYDEDGVGGIVSGRIGIYSEFTVPLYIDLSGTWKFHIGDLDKWKNEDYNDSNWDNITVPASWESQGYPDHDDYAWYRKEFTIDKSLKDERLILVLGKIDDIDEVYLNGKRVGRTGRFPGERYVDRGNPYWNKERFYYIHSDDFHWNKKNTIAIRVYDVWNVGGIYEGPIGITTKQDYLAYKKERRYKVDRYYDSGDFFNVIEDIVDAFDDIF